jgi:hypothetical protein
MPARSTTPESPQRLYSGASTLAWAEQNVLSIMYMIGMDENDLETVTIDEILQGIKDTYYDIDAGVEQMIDMSGTYRKINASQAFLHKQSDWLFLLARRFWRQRLVGTHEVSIGV